MTTISTLLDVIAAAPDEDAQAGLLRRFARGLLPYPSGIADLIEWVLEPERADIAWAAASLMATVLDEARTSAENDAPEGAAMLLAAEEALAIRDIEAPMTSAQRISVAQLYARVGLAPPSIVQLSPETIGSEDVEHGGNAMPDIAELLDPLLKEFGDQYLQVHTALTELFAGFPSEFVTELVTLIVARPGAVETRLGLYWLLDPDPDLRLAAATALAARSASGPLPAKCATFLPAIRKLLCPGPARTVLDTIIRQQQRHGFTNPGTGAKIHRSVASLPDGAGAQTLFAAVQSGGRRVVVMVMLKQGHGIKDALVIPCNSASEQRRLLSRLAEEVETFDLSDHAWVRMMARGFGEGLAADRMPAAGALDLLELFGPDMLSPVAADSAALLTALGVEAVLDGLSASRNAALHRASANWLDHFAQLNSWFEDTTALREAIGRARSDSGREAAVWKQIAVRRDWWARQFAVSATVLKDAERIDPDLWLSFAVAARALLEGVSPKRLPIMQDIASMTLDAYVDRTCVPPAPGGHINAKTLLVGSGISAPFLRGYLTALSITPLEPDAQDWIGGLLANVEFPGRGTLDVVMKHVVTEANMTDAQTGDPETTTRMLAELDSDGLRAWATGFITLVAAVRDCWPMRRLSADDQRVLRALEKIASGEGDSDIFPVLPAWVARRHALRD